MNKKVLYLDCSSGISGDMTVAALLDLGADEHKLLKTLASLPLDGYEIKISRVKKSAIDACDFDVVLDKDHENHDHDMAYLHGPADPTVSESSASDEHEHEHEHHHDHEHEHEHHHDHEHEHHHGHEHEHEHHHDHEHAHGHGHDHHGRGLPEIEKILEAGDLTPGALALAKKIFLIVAEAEAHVHGKPLNEVHFHEVGAVDSIVDIASVAICLDDLGVDSVIIPVLNEGTGQVRCQHGLLPIPVPAVTAIMQSHSLPIHITQVQGELITPTGAAIAAAIRTDDKMPENFKIEKIGIGAGKRDYACAGILRAMLLDVNEQASTPASSFDSDDVTVLETNIDDCSGEVLGFVMNTLLKAGALDVWYTPIQMKKNRPAILLSVLCKEDKRHTLEELIFRHTTTIGIRYRSMHRDKLVRQAGSVETPWGEAKVKYAQFADVKKCYPESDSVTALAEKTGMSYEELFSVIKQIAREQQ